ncbi:hypothetical protein U9M48_031158 [Paspalum notatum var. saurae]|uniref:Uncharacterized protein n=1 Tax=Paspalum notatum var. saurae TaxID=547442 RepID=A0AAQ3U285_PASNO
MSQPLFPLLPPRRSLAPRQPLPPRRLAALCPSSATTPLRSGNGRPAPSSSGGGRPSPCLSSSSGAAVLRRVFPPPPAAAGSFSSRPRQGVVGCGKARQWWGRSGAAARWRRQGVAEAELAGVRRCGGEAGRRGRDAAAEWSCAAAAEANGGKATMAAGGGWRRASRPTASHLFQGTELPRISWEYSLGGMVPSPVSPNQTLPKFRLDRDSDLKLASSASVQATAADAPRAESVDKCSRKLGAAVKAKVQVAAASSVTMVSHTCASPSAVRKKRTVKKNVDSIEGACGGDQAAGMEFDCAGSVRGGGAAGAYGQVVQRPTQGTKSPMSSISLNLGRLSMPERDCILVKAQINFSSFGVDPLVKLILVILEQLTIRWLSFRNSALLKDLSKSSRQRMFDFFESFWKSPCLSNVPRRVTLAICMALSRNECNMLLLSSLVAMLLLLLLLLLFTSSSLSFGRSSTPERDCRLVKRKVIFSSSGAAPFSKNMPVMLQLSVRKYSRHLNLSSLKLGKRVETILIQLGATKSYLGKLIFIFSQQCLKKLHFLLSRTLGGCFRLKPLSAAGDPLLEVFPKRISPLQRPETLMQVTARIKFLRDPYAEEFLGHAWNQISVTSQKTLQFQENEMLCRRCMHLCLTDIRRELLEEFVDVVRAAKVDIVEDGEMTSQGVVQLVQFFIASHGVSVQSMSEYPHAEFMILAFLQDVVNNLGAGVAIILMLACKLEHCIMVESNKRIFYRLSLWWIAIIFGLLDALCVGDD